MSLLQRPRTPLVCALHDVGDIPDLEPDTTSPPPESPPTPTGSTPYHEVNDRFSLSGSPCVLKARTNISGPGFVPRHRERSGAWAVEKASCLYPTDVQQHFEFVPKNNFNPYTTTLEETKAGTSLNADIACFSANVDCNFSSPSTVSPQTKGQQRHHDYTIHQQPINTQVHSITSTNSTIDVPSASVVKMNRLRASPPADNPSIQASSAMYGASPLVHNQINTPMTHNTSFHDAVSKLDSILPYTTATRLNNQPDRCVYTNKTRSVQCGHPLAKAGNERRRRLIERGSRLGSSFTLTDIVTFIKDVIAECVSGSSGHRKMAERHLQDLLDSVPADICWNRPYHEQTTTLATQADIDTLFKWLCSITTLSSEPKALDLGTQKSATSRTQSQDNPLILKENDIDNRTSLSERYILRNREKESVKSNSYHATKTNSWRSNLCPPAETAIGQDFVPYQTESTKYLSIPQLIRNALLKPLTPVNDHLDGYIYMYWIAGNFGYCKIGVTKRDRISYRLKEWERKCHHIISSHNLIGSNSGKSGMCRIPHVYRVESLVQAELHLQRRREVKCTGCGRGHKEWFRENAEHAKKVISKWSQWMLVRNPWDTTPLTESEIEDLCRPLPHESLEADNARRLSCGQPRSRPPKTKGKAPRRSARIAARITPAEDSRATTKTRSRRKQSDEASSVELRHRVNTAAIKVEEEEDSENGCVKLEDAEIPDEADTKEPNEEKVESKQEDHAKLNIEEEPEYTDEGDQEEYEDDITEGTYWDIEDRFEKTLKTRFRLQLKIRSKRTLNFSIIKKGLRMLRQGV